MENTAQQQPSFHREGDTIKQIERESKKPRFKWLPRLSFLNPRKDNTPTIKSNVADYQAVGEDEELTAHLEIGFDALVAERNKLLSELQHDDLLTRNLSDHPNMAALKGAEWIKEAERILDNIYPTVIVDMVQKDRKSRDKRFYERIYPHIISRIDKETGYFVLHKQLGIFPLVAKGIEKSETTTVDGIKIHWGQKMKSGGQFLFGDSIRDIIIKQAQLSQLSLSVKEKLRMLFLPKREIRLPYQNEGEGFKAIVLLGMIASRQNASSETALIHEIIHSLHMPNSLTEDILMLLSLAEKIKASDGSPINVEDSNSFALHLYKNLNLLQPIFQMLDTERHALMEAHAYSRSQLSRYKVATESDMVETVVNAKTVDLSSDQMVAQLTKDIAELQVGQHEEVLMPMPDGTVKKISLSDTEERKKFIMLLEEQKKKRVAELLSEAPRVYSHINPEHFMYAVHAVSRLEALGLSQEEIGELIKYSAGWDEETKTFPDIEATISKKIADLNLTENDVENLVIARRLEKEIDALKAELIARQEVKKFYFEYYAQK